MALIHFYNTLTGRKEEFKPLEKGRVGIYNCGPTVYDIAHIGNLRTYILDDIVRRVFEYNGYFVNQVMNITDVDDKTIRRSKEQNKSLEELTRYYETLFLADLHSLNILTPNRLLRARDHIKEMIEMIVILLEKGVAYITKDGVYFSIGLFRNYGELAKLKIEATDTSTLRERISNDEYEKENPRDFALWKFFREEDENVQWEAPFGKGRPGWHIECSAMSTWALGPTIDIHTGGTDLIFPHHTNEIAQSEATTDKHFVNYWIHGAFINVNDEKMAKSKGNFLKLADIEEAGISPLAFRYWLMTSHYRSQINFSIGAVKSAQTAFIRLIEAFIRLGEVEHEHIHASAIVRDYKNEFLSKINDDFNMPEAIALTWDLIKDHTVEAKKKVKLMLDFDRVFGFGLKGVADMKEEIPAEVIALAETREIARKAKEWDKADALRKEIETRGFEIKDTDESFELSKNNKICL
ncbi:MAG: cysteine--tRNA ligase [Patescibacteria group bacterium]